MTGELWASGDVYESYVGRWSRLVAREFVGWLARPARGDWLDVGCGTGALTSTVLAVAEPASVVGIDPSAGFIEAVRQRIPDPRARFDVGDARALPADTGAFDTIVSGLVLNFVPEPARGLAEMRRAARPGAVVAAYVWDYAHRMELMRIFWDAAIALDPAADAHDEGRRFPITNPDPLRALWENAGLRMVEVRAIDVPTVFRDFDDYWTPFLGGQAPAPAYCMSLDEDRRATLREHIRSRLPFEPDGRIRLAARAWAVRGTTP